MSNKLYIRLTKDSNGSEIKLDELKLNELSLLKDLLDSFSQLIIDRYDPNDFTFKIEEGSACFGLETKNGASEKYSDDLFDVINHESKNKLTVKHYRNIQKLLRDSGFQFETTFTNSKGEKRSLTSVFMSPKNFYATGVKIRKTYSLEFIQGKLNNVGGKNPNFHIERTLGEEPTVYCSETDVMQLAKSLYKKIFVLVEKEKRDNGDEKRQLVSVFNEAEWILMKDFHKAFSGSKGLDKHEYIFEFIEKLSKLGQEHIITELANYFCTLSVPAAYSKTLILACSEFGLLSNDQKTRLENRLIIHYGRELV